MNDVCQMDAKSIPHIQDNLPFLAGAKFFSTIDYQNGFWQIEMDPDDRHKTAYSTPDGRLYQCKVMPFGLCNSLGTFERLVEEIFSGLQYRILLLYLDDVLIYGSTFNEQLERLKIIFDRIRESKIKLKPKKCVLFKKEVTYLGHLVSEGVTTDPEKIKSVKEWPRATKCFRSQKFCGTLPTIDVSQRVSVQLLPHFMILPERIRSFHGPLSVKKPS